MPLIDPITMSERSVAPFTSRTAPRSQPIELLHIPAAQLTAHLQPVFLLSTLWLGFPALVADPVAALAWGILPLAVTKIVFCVVCLPVAGASTKASRRAQKIRGTSVRKLRESAPPLSANISVSSSR